MPQPADINALPRGSISSRPSSRTRAAFAGSLGSAIEAADVAAVLLRLKPAGERDLINRIKSLAAGRAEQGHRAGARRTGRDRGARRRRRRASDRDRGFHRGGREPQAGAYRGLRRLEDPGRGDGCRRTRRGLRDVRRDRRRGRRPSFEAIVERIAGGPSCSRFPASALPQPRKRSVRSWPRGRISSRSATASGTIRAAPWPLSPRWPSARRAGDGGMNGDRAVLVAFLTALLATRSRGQPKSPAPAASCRCQRTTGYRLRRNTSAATTSRPSRKRRGGSRRKTIPRP